MINNLLIFIPQELCVKQSGYMFGKVIHDKHSNLKKFYIINLPKIGSSELTKCTLDTIGYCSNMNNEAKEFLDYKHSDWVHVTTKCSENAQEEYYLANIILDNKRIDLSTICATIILYNNRALQETELFRSRAASGDHFYELTKLIQSMKDELKIKSKFVCIWETLLTYHIFFYLYPVLWLSKITKKLLPVLKYSSLGLHVYNWLENIKWMLITILHEKNFKLKTGNYALAIVVDIALGIFVLQLLQYYIEDQPSQLLLNNAEVN